MKRRSPQLQFEFIFHPLGVIDGVEYDNLSKQLAEQTQIPSFPLRALRRRETWAIELPRGAFMGDLSGSISMQEDIAERDVILERIKANTGAYHLDRTRDLIHRNGTWYYRRRALEVFRVYVKPNELFVAAFNFIKKAEEDPTYVMGEPKPQGKPIVERPIVNGRRAPGPRWREREDYVLKKWFGKWADGKHHPLTETQWERVLDELGGFRSKQSVKRRLSELNAELKQSLLRDGYIHRDDVKKYMDGFLGERVVVPRFRPRLHGDYYPKSKRRNPVSSLQRSDGTMARRRTINDEAKKRILNDPPPGFVATTITSHLDLAAAFNEAEEAAEV